MLSHGFFQVFREQDLKLQPPRVTNIKLEKLELVNVGDTNKAPSSNSSVEDAPSSAVADVLSDLAYIVRWDVDGDGDADYFSIYLTAGDLPVLVGHTAMTTFVTSIAAKFICNNRVTLIVQPVLSATGLPLVLSKCSSESVAVPRDA